jgi:type I restriction enzyme S subunit
LTELYRYPTFYGIDYKTEGIPVLKIENITKDGFIDDSSISYIDEETSNKYPKTILKENDCILAVRGATIGKIALVPKKFEGANINANLIKITVDQTKINPRYFWSYMNSNLGKKQFEAVTTSSAKQTITTEAIRRIKIPLPSLEKQQEIVNFFNIQYETLTNIRRLKENAKQTIKMILDREVFGE